MHTQPGHVLDRSQGLYSEIAHHRSSNRTVFRGHLFSSRNALQLADHPNAEARVSRFGLERLTVANVRSTGHDVAVSEVSHTTVIVPLNGRLISSASSAEVQAHTGGILVFPPNRRQTRVVPDGASPFDAITILVPQSEIREALLRVDASPRDLNRLNDVPVWLDGEALPEVRGLRSLATLLHGEICRGGPAIQSQGTRRAWARLIVDKLSEVLEQAMGAQTQASVGVSASNMHVDRALCYIRAHLDSIASVADVADACGVSTRTLELAFRQAIGITPHQAITEIRLDAARRRLVDPESEQSVTEIAMSCGILHLGRFSRNYRLRFGELPSATRNGHARGVGHEVDELIE